MIGISGQYLLKFDLAGHGDFIREEDLIEFALIEVSGNLLPMFEMTFRLRDSRMKCYFNEGNKFTMAIGKSYLELINIPLYILASNDIMNSADSCIMSVTGIYFAADYVKGDKTYISDYKSGVEVMIEEAGKYFNVKTNINKSYDKQNWIQPGISTKQYIDELWLGSYIKNSFLAVAISINSFIIKDVKAMLKDQPTWYMSTAASPGNNQKMVAVSYAGNTNDSGFCNLLTGYDENIHEHDLDSGKTSTIDYTVSPIMSIGMSKLPRTNAISSPMYSYAVTNSNTHINHTKAVNQNLANLVALGSSAIKLTFAGQFRNIKPLDLVMYGEPDISRRQFDAQKSGIYIVSKVVRHITKRKFITNVILCRESLNELKGDFK